MINTTTLNLIIWFQVMLNILLKFLSNFYLNVSVLRRENEIWINVVSNQANLRFHKLYNNQFKIFFTSKFLNNFDTEPWSSKIFPLFNPPTKLSLKWSRILVIEKSLSANSSMMLLPIEMSGLYLGGTTMEATFAIFPTIFLNTDGFYLWIYLCLE